MSPDRWQRMQDIFGQALTVAPDQREQFLKESCGADCELYAELAALLQHDAEIPAKFMEPLKTGATVETSHAPAATDALIGQRIGRYKVKSVIATGGMGTVYEAIQDEPHRTVALKVVNRALLSAGSVRRFQFEAQVLGRLRHPNVAQIYEAGMHGDGRCSVPFFAMEYVPGAKTITAYADEKKVGTRARLALFARVCDAVYHGHQKGIIHRDLKPANILVDSDGEPKVIDFGVARATDSDVALTTHQTNIGQLIGTIQYMSPEQCDADPHDIDTRTDVYSLGVVLYELLTGQLPYDTTGTTIAHATQTVKEQAARRPSRIDRRLRGDVETIVLKALEKDRSRRYRSAAELGEDIRRYLNGRPIAARPPSVSYLATRFVRRHPWQVVATGLAVLLLISGSIGFTINARLGKTAADRERAAAVQKQQLAQRISALRGAETALLTYDVGTARQLLDQAEQTGTSWELRHWKARLDQSAVNLTQVPRPIRHVCVDPRSRFVAICQSGAADIEVRSLNDGRVLARMDLDGREPRALGINRDGTLLAVSTNANQTERGGLLWLFDLSSSSPELLARWATDPESAASSLAFHPSQPLLASAAGNPGVIRLWNLDRLRAAHGREDEAGREPQATLIGHRERVEALVFSGSGRLLASTGKDSTVRIWDCQSLSDGQPAECAVLCGHSFTVDCLAFSPDEGRLASGGVDGTIRIWDVAAALAGARQPNGYAYGPQVQLDVLYGHDAPVRAVVFDATGSRLASGGDDRALRLWETNESASVQDPGTERRELRIPRRRLLAALRGHEGPIVDAAYLPDGRIVSASINGAIRLWWPEGEDVPRLRGHSSSLRAVAFTPDSSHLVSADASDGIIVWDPDRCIPVARRHVRGGEGLAGLVCWETPGEAARTLLAVGTGVRGDENKNGGRVIVWDLTEARNPVCVGEATAGAGISRPAVCALAVSADKKQLAVGDERGTLRIWTVSDKGLGQRVGEDIKLADVPISELAFLPAPAERNGGGAFILAACGQVDGEPGQDSALYVWDATRNKLAWSSQTQSGGGVSALAIDPSGTRLATASHDSKAQTYPVCVWSVDWSSEAPALLREQTLTGHTDLVSALAFHPTEARLASGSRDQTIRIWDLGTQVEVATLFGHKGPVRDLAFDSNGERLASASAGSLGADNVVWLWEAVAPQRAREYAGERAVCVRAYREVQQAVRISLPSLDNAERRIAEFASDSPWLQHVHETAARNFCDFVSRPGWLNAGAWDVVSRDELSDEQYERARRWAQRAWTTSPWDGQILNTLGIALGRCGRYQEAVEALRRAGELNNWHPVDHAFLAVAYYRLGDKSAAQEELQRARRRCTERGLSDVPELNQLMDEAQQLIEGRPPLSDPR